MKILFFQAGSFAEAVRRFEKGLPETYRDQKQSVRFVEELARDHAVTVISFTGQHHDTHLRDGLRSIGVDFQQTYQSDLIDRLLNEIAPEMIVCRAPHYRVIRWAKRSKVPVLPTFADSFRSNRVRDVYRNLRLRDALSAEGVPCVSNHSLNASMSLSKSVFISKRKIVPWDWGKLPVRQQTKSGIDKGRAPAIFFAGALREHKGLGDIMGAQKHLRDRGLEVRLQVAGGGDLDPWRQTAAAEGVGDLVDFLGMIPHEEATRRMASVDLVVVPSRHSYPEGLPNTIYEALAARTPLIVSDHPTFQGRLLDRQQCLVFKSPDTKDLADKIQDLWEDRDLYERLSANSEAAHNSLYVGINWKELVEKFIGDPFNRNGWVERNSLAALGY